MDMQQVADRLAVEELVSRYTWAIDGQEWGALRQIFTPDAEADYTSLADDASMEGLDAIVAWLQGSLGWRTDAVPWHFVSNHVVELDGDTAESKHYMHNRHLTVYGRYHVSSVRTVDGWRIKKLVLRASMRQGPLPDRPMSRPPGS